MPRSKLQPVWRLLRGRHGRLWRRVLPDRELHQRILLQNGRRRHLRRSVLRSLRLLLRRDHLLHRHVYRRILLPVAELRLRWFLLPERQRMLQRPLLRTGADLREQPVQDANHVRHPMQRTVLPTGTILLRR
jgi:hypothetical protein